MGVCHGIAKELDLVFRSAMQSGIVDAEEGEMIRSVRNLDSKRIKAGTGIANRCKQRRPLSVRIEACLYNLLIPEEIMTPLVDMICIESEEPISKLHNVIKETQPHGCKP